MRKGCAPHVKNSFTGTPVNFLYLDWPISKMAGDRDSVTTEHLLPNTHRRRRLDSTVELSRVGGVCTIRN